MRGIVTSRIDEVDVVRERPLDRLCPVVDLGDDAEVGLAVEQLAQPVAHDRMVVGEEHAGDQRSGHRDVLGRQPQRHLGAVRLERRSR